MAPINLLLPHSLTLESEFVDSISYIPSSSSLSPSSVTLTSHSLFHFLQFCSNLSVVSFTQVKNFPWVMLPRWSLQYTNHNMYLLCLKLQYFAIKINIDISGGLDFVQRDWSACKIFNIISPTTKCLEYFPIVTTMNTYFQGPSGEYDYTNPAENQK